MAGSFDSHARSAVKPMIDGMNARTFLLSSPIVGSSQPPPGGNSARLQQPDECVGRERREQRKARLNACGRPPG